MNKYVPIPNKHKTVNIILFNTSRTVALFMYVDWHLCNLFQKTLTVIVPIPQQLLPEQLDR